MAEFAENLKQIRTDRGISQAKLASDIGVTKSTIGLYETSKNTPNVIGISKICNYFNVSADWLLGLGNRKVPEFKQLRDYGSTELLTELLRRQV